MHANNCCAPSGQHRDACPSHPPPLTHLTDYIPGLTGTMATRTRVTVAGAIVSAVADLLLMLLIGELTGLASCSLPDVDAQRGAP